MAVVIWFCVLQLFVHNFVHGDLHPGNILVQQDSDLQHPTLVMLDCGIATSLSPADLENLLCVFTAIVTGQGWKVADLFLNQKQSCSAIEEFRSKVGMLVDSAVKDLNLKEVGFLYNVLATLCDDCDYYAAGEGGHSLFQLVQHFNRTQGM